MAGLWEPVSGVFWSAPPPVVLPDEGVSVYWFVLGALAVATFVVAGVWHSLKKAEPAKWSLRNHLGKVGSAMTYAYLVIIVAMIWGRSGQLLTMPLNEVGDFLAGAFGPVAFLWLVLGFLQQGDELRQGTEALKLQADELKNSVEQQRIMAASALKQIDAQAVALELQHREREAALCANFTLRFSTSGGGTGKPGVAMNRIKLRNDGSAAFNTVITFSPPFVNISEKAIGYAATGDEGEMTLEFVNSAGVVEGAAIITYDDKEGTQRSEHFSYVVRARRINFDKLRPDT
ncbi:hypothetical protein LVV80_17050 [Pseudomonas sp. KCA11]|uniref:hypothetical protein n=1 Tax=Pseudomonas sp. KCA11 TaxID=2899114 RepID=UPI001F1F4F8D|nr:hypothetical protein [Pseudomonas sp. KCA11]MCE5993709.1 hypothetical protein [Pseudomonas sp. KCA11]